MGRGWQRVSQCHIFLQHPGITSTLFSIYGRPCRWYTGYAKICLWDSHSKTINWTLAGRQNVSLRRVDRRLLPWQSPSNSRTRNVIHRRGAHLERPAEKFLIFRFLSAKRCYLTEIFAKTHGTIPSGTQRRNDNTPGPSRLVSRHCRPRLGPGPCPAGAQDERPYEV